jgi:hypothetical protein
MSSSKAARPEENKMKLSLMDNAGNRRDNTDGYDEVAGIIAYETGKLDFDGTVELFQHLVDNGHAWTLQGSYGRTAKALIEAGHVVQKTRA